MCISTTYLGWLGWPVLGIAAGGPWQRTMVVSPYLLCTPDGLEDHNVENPKRYIPPRVLVTRLCPRQSMSRPRPPPAKFSVKRSSGSYRPNQWPAERHQRPAWPMNP